jgi:hypothetical protein
MEAVQNVIRLQIYNYHLLEGKRPLGRPGRRWEDNIKADLQEVECGGMEWIELS